MESSAPAAQPNNTMRVKAAFEQWKRSFRAIAVSLSELTSTTRMPSFLPAANGSQIHFKRYGDRNTKVCTYTAMLSTNSSKADLPFSLPEKADIDLEAGPLPELEHANQNVGEQDLDHPSSPSFERPSRAVVFNTAIVCGLLSAIMIANFPTSPARDSEYGMVRKTFHLCSVEYDFRRDVNEIALFDMLFIPTPAEFLFACSTYGAAITYLICERLSRGGLDIVASMSVSSAIAIGWILKWDVEAIVLCILPSIVLISLLIRRSSRQLELAADDYGQGRIRL